MCIILFKKNKKLIKKTFEKKGQFCVLIDIRFEQLLFDSF